MIVVGGVWLLLVVVLCWLLVVVSGCWFGSWWRVFGDILDLFVSPSPTTGLGGKQLHSPKIDLFSSQLHLNFTSQNHLNITSLQTLRGPHLDPPWATQIDPKSTQVAS